MQKAHHGTTEVLAKKTLRAYFEDAKTELNLSSRTEELDLQLLEATSQGNEQKVRELIFENANVLATDSLGRNAGHLAIERGHWNLLKLIQEPGYGEDARARAKELIQSLLHEATGSGKEEVVTRLLETGAQPSALSPVDVRGTLIMRTALHTAAEGGQEATARKLLGGGAEVDGLSGDGQTAMCLGIKAGHEGIVKLLLENDADVRLRSDTLDAPFTIAVRAGNESILKLLLENGANIHTRSNNDETALSMAIWAKSDSVVKFLLQNGALVDGETKYGGTALQQAASMGRESTVRLLLEGGTDVNKKSSIWGKTALHAAAGTTKNETVITLLIQSGADVKAGNADGLTPLSYAVGTAFGHRGKVKEANVKLLLEAGATISVDDWNRLPSDLQEQYINRKPILLPPYQPASASAYSLHRGSAYGWSSGLTSYRINYSSTPIF